MRAQSLLLLCFILSTPVAGADRLKSSLPDLSLVRDGSVLFESLRPLAEIKKDQYETTAAFTKRVCAATAKALGVNEDTPITFVLEHGKYATFAQYDADKQAFSIKLGTEIHYKEPEAPYDDRWRWEPSIDKFKFNSVWLDRRYMQSRATVPAENAFGVTKDVKIGQEDMVVLFFPTRSFDTQFQFIGTRIRFPAKPELAKAIDGDLRIAIVGRLHAPCFIAGRSHTSPTMAYPYDQTTFEAGVVINPNPEWLLYRASTKEVLKRGTFK